MWLRGWELGHLLFISVDVSKFGKVERCQACRSHAAKAKCHKEHNAHTVG